jgi:hypothetical protein
MIPRIGPIEPPHPQAEEVQGLAPSSAGTPGPRTAPASMPGFPQRRNGASVDLSQRRTAIDGHELDALCRRASFEYSAPILRAIHALDAPIETAPLAVAALQQHAAALREHAVQQARSGQRILPLTLQPERFEAFLTREAPAILEVFDAFAQAAESQQAARADQVSAADMARIGGAMARVFAAAAQEQVMGTMPAFRITTAHDEQSAAALEANGSVWVRVNLGGFEWHAAFDPRSLHASAPGRPEPDAPILSLKAVGGTADAPMMAATGVPAHAKHALAALCCLFHEFTHAAELGPMGVARAAAQQASHADANADPNADRSLAAVQATLGEYSYHGHATTLDRLDADRGPPVAGLEVRAQAFALRAHLRESSPVDPAFNAIVSGRFHRDLYTIARPLERLAIAQEPNTASALSALYVRFRSAAPDS